MGAIIVAAWIIALSKSEGVRAGTLHRLRRELDPAEQRELSAQIRGLVIDCDRDIRNASTQVGSGAGAVERAAVEEALSRILSCNSTDLAREAVTFHQVYKPISILPPINTSPLCFRPPKVVPIINVYSADFTETGVFGSRARSSSRNTF